MKTFLTLTALLFSVILFAQIPPCRTPYLDLSTGRNHETNQEFSFNETDPFWQISNGPALYAPYPHCAVSTGNSANIQFQQTRSLTLNNYALSGNMLPVINNCNYTDQPFLFERKIEIYTGPANPALEVVLAIDQITANYSVSSIILNGPGGPFVIFSGCINNQSVMLPTTVLYLQSGYYSLQVNVGNEWDVNGDPTNMFFQMKAAIYSASAIFSDNLHYGKHSSCSPPYVLPQTPVLVNDCYIPPSTQSEVIIDNFQYNMNYSITPPVTLNTSTFMADANTTYTITVQDGYGCSLSATTTMSVCLLEHFQTKVFIEGLFLTQATMIPLKYLQGWSNNTNDVDDITLILHESQHPYTTVCISNAIVQSDGYAYFSFPPVQSGLYYVELNYKNALAVWSSNPVILFNNTLIDFTLSPGSVFGGTTVEVDENVYALISGDINQDDVIDQTDAFMLQPDIENGNSGYLLTDLNGDGSVDAFDYLIIYPKLNAGGISAASP